MPAVSQQQQKFMGMAHAMQKGEKVKGASKELKKAAKGMSKKAAHDYAATKHKGLPDHVKESEVIEGVVLTEGQFKKIATYLLDRLETGTKGYNIKPAVELHDKQMAQRVIRNVLGHDDFFRGRPHTLKQQLEGK